MSQRFTEPNRILFALVCNLLRYLTEEILQCPPPPSLFSSYVSVSTGIHFFAAASYKDKKWAYTLPLSVEPESSRQADQAFESTTSGSGQERPPVQALYFAVMKDNSGIWF